MILFSFYHSKNSEFYENSLIDITELSNISLAIGTSLDFILWDSVTHTVTESEEEIELVSNSQNVEKY